MLRRTVIAACVSLTAGAAAVALAGPNAVFAQGIAQPGTGQRTGLPRTLGGLPQTNFQRETDTQVRFTYAGPGAVATVGIASGFAGAPDGGESGAMENILERLHRATTRDRSDLQLAGENRVYRLGEQGREWTWRGNMYTFRAPNGAPGRRMLLVTGHRDTLVWAQIDITTMQNNVDLRPFINELSAFLASTRGAVDQRIAPGAPAKG